MSKIIKSATNEHGLSLTSFYTVTINLTSFFNVAINLIRANSIIYVAIFCTVHCGPFTSTCSDDITVSKKTYF